MKILIAYDGSLCAKAAIQDLRRAGLPTDVDALVITCADLLLNMEAFVAEDVSPAVRTAVMVRQARELAKIELEDANQTSLAGMDLVTSHFAGWKVQSGAAVDAPYAAIIHKAEKWPADLVVIGSHGRSALGRLVLGSVSQMVLAHSPCSVRIGRGPTPALSSIPLADDPVRIMLAIDLSPDSAAAVEAVRLRSWPAGSEVCIVTSVDAKLLTAMVMTGAHLEADPAQEAAGVVRSRLDSVARELRDVGLAATAIVVEGDPKRSVVEQAERWGADCIFLGAKGHNRLAGFLLGRVSAAVAARAHCSVEVVRTR